MNNSLKKALTYLNDGIESGVWPAGSRMPTIVQLKKQAHVSQEFMQSAVTHLKEKGILSVTQKRGIFVGSPRYDYSKPTQPIVKWQVVRNRIHKDILEKTILIRGIFPAIADLQKKHGASGKTCKKALESLIAQGTLIRLGRRYCIKTSVLNPGNTTIGFYAKGEIGGQVSIFNTRISLFLQQLQRSCDEAGISLVPIGIDSQKKAAAPISAQSTEGTFGAVLYCLGLTPAEIATVITTYKTRNLPLAIFDELGDLPITLPDSKNLRIKIFSLAKQTAGFRVGTFLLKMGHRKIAYFSTDSTSKHEWSRLRLGGLTDAFAQAGYPDGVIATTTITTSNTAQSNTEPGIDPDLHLDNIAALATYEKKFQAILRRQFFLSRTLFIARMNISQTIYNERELFKLQPIMRTMLKDKSVTAWVGNNDHMALALNSFLTIAGVNIPKTLSVLGFDNTEEAQESRVTSYDFDVAGIAHKSIQYIINPKHELFKNFDRIECEGFVVERRTTQQK